jgi:hypothetical protein
MLGVMSSNFTKRLTRDTEGMAMPFRIEYDGVLYHKTSSGDRNTLIKKAKILQGILGQFTLWFKLYRD